MTLVKNFGRLKWLAIAFVLAAPWSMAQFSSSVQGTVTDPQKAVVANARVTLHNVATGVDNRTKTNESGFYRFDSVAPGQYRLLVEASGFANTSVSAEVLSETTTGIDISLRVGQTATNVTVESVTQALNPDETRIQTTITSDELKQLPLPNKNPLVLSQLAPGTVGILDSNNTGGYGSNIFAGSVTSPISANGLDSHANLFVIDDLPVMSSEGTGGTALILPNPEMIAEAAIQTATFSTQYGQAASIQSSYTTKSGSNQFHGVADYDYSGKSFTATQDFSKPFFPFHRYYATGAMGGPIIKDRTFFFGSVESFNSLSAGSSEGIYISPEFGSWALQHFPNNGGARELGLAPPDREHLDHVVHTAMQVYPNSYQRLDMDPAMPISDDGFFDQSNPYNGLQWNVRLDQYFRNGNDRVSIDYVRLDQKSGYLSDRPNLDSLTPSQNKYISASYTHIFNPRLVNDAHFGNLRAWSTNKANPILGSVNYGDLILEFGENFDIFDFLGIFTPFAGQTDKQHTYEFRDNVSWVKGTHSARFGFQYEHLDSWFDQSSIYSRPFFPGWFEPHALTDFVQDQNGSGWSTFTIGGNGAYQPQIFGSQVTRIGFYVQDEWKIRPTLLITYGLRFDSFGNPSKYGDRSNPFDPIYKGTGSSLAEQIAAASVAPNSNAFSGNQFGVQPRGGFNWNPAANRMLVIHGGVGLYEDAVTPAEVSASLPANPPNRISVTTSSSYPAGSPLNSNPIPYGDFKTATPPYGFAYRPFPVYGTDPRGNIYSDPAQTTTYPANIRGYDRSLAAEKLLNYNLGVEWEVPARLVVGMAYLGSHGWNELYQGDWNTATGIVDFSTGLPNRPTSEWGAINYGLNGLVSNYNALAFTARQQYKTFSWQAAYTFSHSLQDQWILASNPHQYYGSAPYDRSNVFSFGGTYEVPRISDNYLLNSVMGGWRLSELAVAQSGTPFSVSTGGGSYSRDYDYNGDYYDNDYPDILTARRGGATRDQYKTGLFSQSQCLDATLQSSACKGMTLNPDFHSPLNFQMNPHEGNEGVNSFRNPNYVSLDTGVQKSFSLPWFGSEKGILSLRLEAINTLNRANLQNVNSQINGSNFGKVTSAYSPRYLQIGGRFEF